ncbi:hypothetical protein [Salinisphaera sp. G21_0]|uniref:hypothetical protein n=1 Tax=Salinisphaera sp. G21_0 TaxID=2821094 RepID=UPI001AD99189|nr:hypothetical protein [Salinisphaera sp. G21_0]MBO9482844.1 hypothetical protein [Salinisphaera sp. G21_0]
MSINPTGPSSQLTIPDNDIVSDSPGKTADNKQVTSTEAIKQIPEASGENTKPSTSLAERKIEHSSDIATPDEFQARIDEMMYLNSIGELIEESFSSHGVQNGKSEKNHATAAGASVSAAFNSINHASGERMEAYDFNGAYCVDTTPAEGATTHGARVHLENAFGHIKEMQKQKNKLNEFSKVDIALSMTQHKNRSILRPHIEAAFSIQENKLKQ